MLKIQEDVLKELAKRTNKPYEQLRIMQLDTWHQIKQILQNPQNIRKGIKFQNCIKFRVNPKEVMKSFFGAIKKPNTKFSQEVLEYFNFLNDNNELTERQKELKQKFERLNSQEGGDEGNNPDEV